MKCDRKSWPNLFAYLDAYGLDESIIARIDRIKGNSESGYYVLGYLEDDGMIGLLDLSHTPDHMAGPEVAKLNWNMLNDGFSTTLSEKDWRKMKLDDACETFRIEGHEEFGYD